MRLLPRGRLAALLAALAFPAPALSVVPSGGEALPLADGSVVPGRGSAPLDVSDRDASRRRAELLRSPYLQVVERRALLGGEVTVGLEAAVPREAREAALRAVERTVREVLDRDAWPRPFSSAYPLSLLLVQARPGVPLVVAWDGREAGRLVRPVLAVGTAGRAPEAVAFDVARGLSLLALRQAGPEEAGWAVEGFAELLAQEAVGLTAPPRAGSSPFLAAQGSLAEPSAAALFLREAARVGSSGRAGLRVAWEEAGSRRGDDAEAFFRSVACGADGGASGLLARLVADAVAGFQASRDDAAARPLFPGETAIPAPEPLGWVRTTFSRLEERSGLEIALPEARSARGARAVLVYRPLAGEPDTLPLAPGGSRVVPLSGADSLALVLVDGEDGGDLAVRLRRVPGYPAVLAATSAEWTEGAVHLGWRTSSHQGLLAWVVSRYREDAEGGIRLDGREIVPTTDASDEGSGYLLVDRDALPGVRYRYRVAALTADGLLSEAFEAAVEAEAAR